MEYFDIFKRTVEQSRLDDEIKAELDVLRVNLDNAIEMSRNIKRCFGDLFDAVLENDDVGLIPEHVEGNSKKKVKQD